MDGTLESRGCVETILVPGAPEKSPTLLEHNCGRMEREETSEVILLFRGKISLDFSILFFNFGPGVQKL